MGAYHYDHSPTPEWCPAAAIASGHEVASREAESSPRQVAQPIREDSRFQMTKDQALTTGVEDEGSAQSQPVTEHACEQAATEGAEPSAADLAWLKRAANLRHMPTSLTYVYRVAISGDGPRAYDWSDKPHRLVYDLCSHIEELAEAAEDRAELLAALQLIAGPRNADLAYLGLHQESQRIAEAAIAKALGLTAADTSDGKEIPGNPKLNNAETPPTSPSDSAEGE
jgi:hypothetical protein